MRTLGNISQLKRAQTKCCAEAAHKMKYICCFTVYLFLSCVEALNRSAFRHESSLQDEETMYGHVYNWADMIANYIKKVAEDGIRREITQELFDKARYTLEEKNGMNVVNLVRRNLSDYFSSRREAARRIAEAAVKAYDESLGQSIDYSSLTDIPSDIFMDSDRNVDDQHSVKGLVANAYFKQNVSEQYSSIKIADDVPRDANETIAAVNWTGALHSVMKQNHENVPHLRWQYFGTKTGVLRIFPGREWNSNFVGFYEDYDPRTRPWYLSATSGPKAVVIIIDCSSSMKGSKFNIAKDVADTIIRTLTKRDYLNVVCSHESQWDEVGNWHPHKSEVLSCQDDHLVPATSAFRRDLINKIQELKPGGTTELQSGFELAFKLLESSREATCQSIIIFVTDGKDTDGDTVRCGPGYYTRSGYVPGPVCKYNWDTVWKMVDEMNAKLQQSAVIFSYLIQDDGERFPGELACRSGGDFRKLDNGQNLITKLENYFTFLAQSEPQRAKGIWTSPYLDDFGLDVMITHAVPAISKIDKKLIGVAGVDMTMEELDMLLMRFLWGSVTAFLIDKEGQTIFHPLLQQSENPVDDPSVVPIRQLEQNIDGKPHKFTEVADAMLRGETGHVLVEDGRRGMQKGDYRAGIRFDTMPLHYYYAPIDGTDYSFAFVLSDTDKEYRRLEEPSDLTSIRESYFNLLIEYNSTMVRKKYPTVYETLDVKSDEAKYPYLRLSYNYSSIFFAAQCYCEPNSYLFENDTAQLTYDAHDFMNDRTTGINKGCDESGKYVSGTRAYVLVTYPIEKYWRERDPEMTKDVMWTYVGMRSGVFRTFPGHRSVRKYDPTNRSWYRRTVANKNKISISAPYMDAAGSGKIITISQAVFEGMLNRSESECVNRTKLPGGCKCERGEECESGSCYLSSAEGVNKGHLRCATERIEAITSLDMAYNAFHDKLFNTMKARVKDRLTGRLVNRDCESTYRCPDGTHDDCKTKCYLFDDRANVIVAPNFRKATVLDETKYRGITLGKEEGEIMHELIFQHEFFERGEAHDFQGICTVSKSAPRVTMEGMPRNPEEEDKVLRGRAQIKTFQNSYGCIQDVISFTANTSALRESRMLSGNVSGPCMSGKYYLTSLRETNLFLLVIENWRDRRSPHFPFNCLITRRVVASGAYRIINGTCAHSDTDSGNRTTGGNCPNLIKVNMNCTYNAGPTLHNHPANLLLQVALFTAARVLLN